MPTPGLTFSVYLSNSAERKFAVFCQDTRLARSTADVFGCAYHDAEGRGGRGPLGLSELHSGLRVFPIVIHSDSLSIVVGLYAITRKVTRVG